MIGSLRGELLESSAEAELLIEVAGVGYRVQVTPQTASGLGQVGSEAFVYVHQAVRDDSETLYGFPTGDERTIFEALISTHGVGPALGLAVLAVHEPAALRLAVAQDDLDALCLVPGVGRKTAARLAMELKSKLDMDSADEAAVLSKVADPSVASLHGDVRAALEALEYGAEEIHLALKDLPQEGEVGDLLKLALRALATGG